MFAHRNLSIALLATVMAFCTLYPQQPLLPLIQERFSVSMADASLLMTASLLPLGIAPIVYGYLLQAVPARGMLQIALVLLSLSQLGIWLAEQFWHLMLLRVIQGLILSAIFTALMTYCAQQSPPGQIRRTMGIYIVATIFGGFGGRTLAGGIATISQWETVFLLLAVMQLIPAYLLRHAAADASVSFSRLNISSLRQVISHPDIRRLFIVVAILLFVYSGVQNFLPFRMMAIDPTTNPLQLSLLYIGYLIGMPVVFIGHRIAGLIGDDRKTLMLGSLAFATTLMLFFHIQLVMSIASMILLCWCFFFLHSQLSGACNELGQQHKSVVNGYYVSIFYLFAGLGSWLPAYVYGYFGWAVLVLSWIVLTLLATAILFGLDSRSDSDRT